MKRGQITAATPVSGVKTIDHSRRPVPPERQDRHVRAANSCGVAVIGSALTAVADDSGQPKPGKDLDRCHQRTCADSRRDSQARVVDWNAFR
jgi:hypothetical protein